MPWLCSCTSPNKKFAPPTYEVHQSACSYTEFWYSNTEAVDDDPVIEIMNTFNTTKAERLRYNEDALTLMSHVEFLEYLPEMSQIYAVPPINSSNTLGTNFLILLEELNVESLNLGVVRSIDAIYTFFQGYVPVSSSYAMYSRLRNRI